MGEFFRGWRRKVGVVTLVMACVFAAGWVRSVIVADFVIWSAEQHSFEILCSADQELSWQTSYEPEDVDVPSTFPVWQTQVLDYSLKDDGDDDQTIWRWRLFGFKAGEIPPQMTGDSSHARFCSVAYWSIVIPLTLLSAWLLLSKPRPAKKLETTAGNSN